MKYLIFLAFPFFVACSDAYRYPCQNPDNWDKQECQKPWCSANGTCPEDLRHYENGNTKQSQNTMSKGECK